MAIFGGSKKKEKVVDEVKVKKSFSIKLSWKEKLKNSLKASADVISDSLQKVVKGNKLDQVTLDNIEEVMIKADLGAVVTNEVISQIKEEKFSKVITDADVKKIFADKIVGKLTRFAKELVFHHSPEVVMINGINGTGKTTSIGKIARFYKAQGKKVLVAAADTYRAAAAQQLEIWAKRAEVDFFAGDSLDPAAIAYAAFQKAKEDSYDVLLIDTAGRLHNQQNLMEQLNKIYRVLKKIDEKAPHHSILVVDATTGQAARQHVEVFQKHVSINGLILTKLDGTAKGGIVVSLVNDFAIPIYFLGVGEGLDDLKPFAAEDFALALFC
jgi:fused signal recognition particle receptor